MLRDHAGRQVAGGPVRPRLLRQGQVLVAEQVGGTAVADLAEDEPGLGEVEQPLRLDITDPASVRAAAEAAPDVTLLINNAGIATRTNLVTGDLDDIRREMDTHFYGNLAMIRAFAPVLAAEGGAILNVLSVLSWLSHDGANSYSTAKAAEWSLTNGVRLELAAQGTLVTGLHLAGAATDMMAGADGDLLDPADVARAGLDGIEAGLLEVLVDDTSRQVKASLAEDPSLLYPQVLSGS
ncbi:SDR family NAD(P)-dependent oxidoreductase [Actinomadura sp. LOL_011]|uniref:SDR family NAD(P)-dependent oxidoreductase n=1 Tax=Actinomadura sp. LOL_011 TaxID=3345410 RepID=UPI003A804EBF